MEFKSPRYTSAGNIDCQLRHPKYGWIPYTASPDDIEPSGREIYQQILDSGVEIAPFEQPESKQ